MDATYWQRQGTDELYPDIRWSRPENKAQAGKLLLIGGSSHGFFAVSRSYEAVLEEGIGECKTIVPDAIKKLIGQQPFINEYAASSVSGGFARASLPSLHAGAAWADVVWCVGDFGRSSETALLLEDLLTQSPARLALSDDSVDFFVSRPDVLLDRSGTLLILDFQRLQALLQKRSQKPITSTLPLAQFVEILHELSVSIEATLCTSIHGVAVVAHGGSVVTSKLSEPLDETLARIVVYWTQFPAQPLEAIATAMYVKK